MANRLTSEELLKRAAAAKAQAAELERAAQEAMAQEQKAPRAARAATTKAPAARRKQAPSKHITHEDLLAAAAASLKKYGTLVPPREKLYPEMMRECPHCQTTKPIMTGFGLRKTASGMRPQPWCRECRNGKDSHPTRYGL